MIEMLNCDCMNYMKHLPDKVFDLAIVDPPYGIGADNFSNGTNIHRNDGWNRTESSAVQIKKNRLNQGSGKLKNRILNTSNCSWDTPPDEQYFLELFRVSKQQIIWGGNYFPLPPTRGIAVWDKVQPWENFSQVELAWTSFDSPAALFKKGTTGGANIEKKIHPTQKPVALYKWLLNRYAKKGNTILDTHGGSGSICVACHDLGFDLTWMELDFNYYNAALERYKAHAAQSFLFDPHDIIKERNKEDATEEIDLFY